MQKRRLEEQMVQHHGDDDVRMEDGSDDPQSTSRNIAEEDDEEVVFDNDDSNKSDSDDSNNSNCDDSDLCIIEDDNLSELDRRGFHAEIKSSLASILQTALNLAVSKNDCRIPVFRIWGEYNGDLLVSGAHVNGGRGITNLPSWIASASTRVPEGTVQEGSSDFSDLFKEAVESHTDENYKEQRLLLSWPILSGMR